MIGGCAETATENEDALEIAFQTRDLRSLCELGENRQQLPTDVHEALKHRLADLRAAVSVHDLPTGSPISCGDNGEFVRIELPSGYVMLLEANHVQNPLEEDGKVDWSRVCRVRVVAVE